MRTLLALFCVAGASYGQTAVSSTFQFTNPKTPQAYQEALTVVRTVVDIPNVQGDAASGTVSFTAPQAKVDMAQWVLSRLDAGVSGQSSAEYQGPGDDVVRIDALANVTSTQSMQEILTVLRTVADVARVFNYSGSMVMRGPAAQIAFAQWIVDQLNVPASEARDAAARVYGGTIAGYGRFATVTLAARVNYLTNITGVQEMQEMLTVLRTVAGINKVFNMSALHAVALCGPEADVARAEWVIDALNQGAGSSGAGIYQTPGADDVTRVFYLSNATQRQLDAAVAAIRTQTANRRLFYMTAPAAVVVRGTADQVEAAVQVIAQHNGLAE